MNAPGAARPVSTLELSSAMLPAAFAVNEVCTALISAAFDEVEYAPQIKKPRAFDLARLTDAPAVDFPFRGQLVKFGSTEPRVVLRAVLRTANPNG